MTAILIIFFSIYSFLFGFMLSAIICSKNCEAHEEELIKIIIRQNNRKFDEFIFPENIRKFDKSIFPERNRPI